MSLQTIKEGQLYKKGKINTEWRQRLFILNGKRLAYFKGSSHSPAGVIELKDIRTVTDVLADGSFQLITPERTFEIRADKREESQEWVDIVRQTMDPPQS